MPQCSSATMGSSSFKQGALHMNPSNSLPLPQLNDAYKHAGGWEKLGWRRVDADQAQDRSSEALFDDEDVEPGLYS